MIRTVFEKKYASIDTYDTTLKIRYNRTSFPKITTLDEKENLYFSEFKEKINEYPLTISVNLKRGSSLEMEINLEEENKQFLYKLALIFAYIVGKRMDIYYFYDNDPHDFFYQHKMVNLNAIDTHYHKRLLQFLLYNPAGIFESFLSLLETKDTFFERLVVAIMEINTLEYLSLKVVIEFELLGKVAEKKLSKERKDIIIQSKEKDNHGVSKEYINAFLEEYDKGKFRNYMKFVKDWNEMRQVVHGFSKKRQSDLLSDRSKFYELHNLLLELIQTEVQKKVSANYE